MPLLDWIALIIFSEVPCILLTRRIIRNPPTTNAFKIYYIHCAGGGSLLTSVGGVQSQRDRRTICSLVVLNTCWKQIQCAGTASKWSFIASGGRLRLLWREAQKRARAHAHTHTHSNIALRTRKLFEAVVNFDFNDITHLRCESSSYRLYKKLFQPCPLILFWRPGMMRNVLGDVTT
jgi:hypothetical protein